MRNAEIWPQGWGMERWESSGPALQGIVLHQESPQKRGPLGILWRLERRFAREAKTNSKDKGTSEKAWPLNHQLLLPVYPKPVFSWRNMDPIHLPEAPSGCCSKADGNLVPEDLWWSQKLCPQTQGSHIPHSLQGCEQGQRQGQSEVGHSFYPNHFQGPGAPPVTQIWLMHMTMKTLSANPGTWGLCQWRQSARLILLPDSSSKGSSEILPSFLSMDPIPHLTAGGHGGLESPTVFSSSSTIWSTWQPPALRSQNATVMGRYSWSPISEVSHGPRVWPCQGGIPGRVLVGVVPYRPRVWWETLSSPFSSQSYQD